jgi:hypothetical protein
MGHRPWTSFLALFTLLGLLAACTDEEGGPAADGPDASADGFGVGGSALTPPDPPELTPCAPGWSEIAAEAGDVAWCDPWPAGGRQDCPPGHAHFPGEPACTRVGSPCPTEGWAVELPGEVPVLYVLDGAGPGGDGTREAPFARVGDALALAAPGTVVAVSAGVYDERLELGEGITLWGACAEGTELMRTEAWTPNADAWEFPDAAELEAVIIVVGAGVQVRNLRVGGTTAGIAVRPGASVALHDVLVTEAFFVGVGVAEGGALEAETLVVADTVEDPGEAMGGFGLFVQGGEATLRRVLLERNQMWSVLALGQARLELSDVALRSTRLVHRDRFFLLPVFDGGAVALMADAEVSLARAVIEDNPGVNLIIGPLQGAEPPERALRLTDVLVRGPEVAPTEVPTSGLLAYGSLELVRTRFVGAKGIAVGLWGAADARLTDVVILETTVGFLEPEADTAGGIGIRVADRSQAELTRVLLLRNGGIGLWTHDDGSYVPPGDPLEEPLEPPVEPPPVEPPAEPPPVEPTEPTEPTEPKEPTEPTERPDRPLPPRSDLPIQARVSGEHVVVRATLEAACVPTCEDGGWGYGVVVTGRTAVDLTRFWMVDNVLAGLQITPGGEADLRSGRVAGHRVGINLQDPAFDVGRLQQDVLYEDNGRNLDGERLPVPNAELFRSLF